jgi:hypothetical protein
MSLNLEKSNKLSYWQIIVVSSEILLPGCFVTMRNVIRMLSLNNIAERIVLLLYVVVLTMQFLYALFTINISCDGKGKGTPNRPDGPEGGWGIAVKFLDLGVRRGRWSAPRLCRFVPGKTQYPLYSRLGVPQDRSELCEKSRPNRDSIPGSPSPLPVSVLTELSRPHSVWWEYRKTL